ncbi:MAG: 3-keto-disaccharide hydrolase [Akkermansiaceae bacterium]
MKFRANRRRILLWMKVYVNHFILACIIAGLFLPSLRAKEKSETQQSWIQLFNGKNLHGWTPKFVGHDLGVNYKNTFIVRNGVLMVCYDKYKEGWHNNMGHLFYKDAFSHYILRVEYRLAGDQVRDAPESLLSMSSLILHGQSPESMGKQQLKPVSLQAQLCIGRKNIYDEGEQVAADASVTVIDANERRGNQNQEGQWTSIEVEVHGGEVIRYKTGGQLIAEYKRPTLTEMGAHHSGTIALQASSYPIQFRKIELKVLGQ